MPELSDHFDLGSDFRVQTVYDENTNLKEK